MFSASGSKKRQFGYDIGCPLSKLVVIEGNVDTKSFNDTIFNTYVARYMLRNPHIYEKTALMSRMFVYAI